MEVQFGLSWNGWSEFNLQFDAFKRSNLPLSDLEENIEETSDDLKLKFLMGLRLV